MSVENGSQVPALRQEVRVALPGRRLAFALAKGDPATVARILQEEPNATGDAIAEAYYNPQIFRGLEQTRPLPGLTELRAQFPSALTYLTDSRINALLDNFLYKMMVETRVADDRALLPPGVEVSQAAMILRQLIADGNLLQLDPDDYPKVFVSTELFDALATNLGAGADAYEHVDSFEEDNRLVRIGARLRQIRDLFELDPDKTDRSYTARITLDREDPTALALREREFKGRVEALKKVMQIRYVLSRRNSNIPNAADRARNLSQGIVWMMEMLLKDFPDKEGLIALEFGTLESSKKIARYAEHPGAPYMSQAEMFDRQI